ncbi:hypothetical protein [Microbulbifer epialgicus]|uniref:Uncharacterized protein n=1 Tax=Microbulbifer epialgicus TaxID=393907 RepID=A0ABV4NT79_9GAMM
MYCRHYDLPIDDDYEFVYQAHRRETKTERYTPTFQVDSHRTKIFPVRTSVEVAVTDLLSKGLDGQVIRSVKTANIGSGDEKIPKIPAGCAARVWIDTSETTADINHKTKEEHEKDGFIVSELYRGPFPLLDCYKIISELKDQIPDLGVIKLGPAYNVAEIIKFEETSTVHIDNGYLCIRLSRKTLEEKIDDWHNGPGDTELHEHLIMPFNAYSYYARHPGNCIFLEENTGS